LRRGPARHGADGKDAGGGQAKPSVMDGHGGLLEVGSCQRRISADSIAVQA
jgi:hypothetical protein